MSDHGSSRRISEMERDRQTYQEKNQLKSVVMGHISASNHLVTDEDFYKFNIDQIIRATDNPTDRRSGGMYTSESQLRKRKALLEKNNFSVNMQMFPSGEKIYKFKFDQQKVVMRVDIYLMIFNFFRNGMPEYSIDTIDKPVGWTNDPNNARRQEIMIEMRQGLICFENQTDAKQTVVCVGDLILTKTRENINQIKLKLLDRLDREVTNGQSINSNSNLSSNFTNLRKNETAFVTADE